MAVPAEYYRNVYGGAEYDDIDTLLKRAEMLIRCTASGEPETEEQRTLYNWAVCAQAEFIGAAGGIEAYASGTGGSVTVGAFSMSSGSSAEEAGRYGGRICPDSEMYLEKAGLLYRGVPVW